MDRLSRGVLVALIVFVLRLFTDHQDLERQVRQLKSEVVVPETCPVDPKTVGERLTCLQQTVRDRAVEKANVAR